MTWACDCRGLSLKYSYSGPILPDCMYRLSWDLVWQSLLPRSDEGCNASACYEVTSYFCYTLTSDDMVECPETVFAAAVMAQGSSKIH